MDTQGAMQSDPVAELFASTDSNNDGFLDFPEVASLFQQLAPQQSAESAGNAAAEALLLSDRNTDRKLSKKEFQQLLAEIASLGGLSLEDAAKRLLEVTQQQQHQQPQWQQQQPAVQNAAQQQDIARADAAHTTSQAAFTQDSTTGSCTAPSSSSSLSDRKGAAAAADLGVPADQRASSSGQLQSLFRLWDKAGDGRINFSELCQGLHKLQQPIKHKKDVTALISEAAAVLAAHDADGDRQLNLAEFEQFMRQFMAAAGFQLHDVLDDLLTLAQTKPESKKLQKVLDAAQPQIQRLLSGNNQ